MSNYMTDPNNLGPQANPWQGKWLVVYTKPRQEQLALQNLERQNFGVYLPRYKKFKNAATGSVPLVCSHVSSL